MDVLDDLEKMAANADDKKADEVDVEKAKEIDDNGLEKMAAGDNPSEEKLTPEQKEELRKEKKFEFPKNFDLQKMDAMFAEDDEEEEVKMAKDEIKKGEFADPSIMMSGMFAKMCKMAEAMVKMAEENRAYMAENEQLKKFKADIEVSQRTFAVEQTLKELSEKVVIPDDARAEMIAEAEKYSFSELAEWVKYCKAKSFDFALKETVKSDEDVTVVALPFTATPTKKKDDLWAS